jgi:DNA invertase Pin-like site-specific DNA recombinase
MRIALYHRVSTTDQSPDAAKTELWEASKRLGGSVAFSIEETGSGASNDRPGLQKVLEAARKGKIDAILVWKLDRFGRSALDLLANLAQLEQWGVRFICTTQGIDLRPGGDPMSRLLLTMLAAVAEFERQLIRERTRLGLARARARGKLLGRKPSHTVTPSQVHELRQQGRTWAQVAKDLNITLEAARHAARKEAR